jgi:FtsP/CotA-like multicopper oxidase with cupredoxin domain
MRIPRRRFLELFGVGAGASAIAGLSGCGVEQVSSDATEHQARGDFVPDAELQLTATDSLASILPGQPTRVWKYEGTVLKGESAILQTIPDSYLGPIIRARRGQKIRIHLNNKLREPTIIHWHGLHLPPEMDGHPRNAVGPGKSYVYDFEIRNRAGTYWFHPHPHQRTGFQVYAGLAGLLLVSDEEESMAGLPSGEFDVPLVIQDRAFNASNQLVYITNPMDQMSGVLGDRILVNGRTDFELKVATRAYRLRILNGSNSRIYKLAWDDGTPLVPIATDGGLLEKPVQRSYVMLGPGERVELWADFSGRRLGNELRLKSLAFSGAEAGMMGGMMGGGMRGGMMGGMMGRGNTNMPQGAEFTVLRIKVDREVKDHSPLPERLAAIQRYRVEDAVNRQNPRVFEVAMRGMGAWTINGRSFEMEGYASDESVKLNTLEMWEFDNQTNSMGAMAHPMHIHGVQFQVLDRGVAPQFESVWETVRAGYIDEGWKDTVLLWPGERVRLLIRFDDFPGLFMYHCHNLEHEDQGLMRNYMIRA